MFLRIQNRDKTGVTFATQPNTTGIVLYNDTGSAVTKGDVLKIGYSTTASEILAGKLLQAQAVATNAVAIERIVIALEDMAIAAIGYFALEGRVEECNIEGTAAVTIGQSLKAVNGADHFVLDHATPTAKQAAIAIEAQAGGAGNYLQPVWLLDRVHTV